MVCWILLDFWVKYIRVFCFSFLFLNVGIIIYEYKWNIRFNFEYFSSIMFLGGNLFFMVKFILLCIIKKMCYNWVFELIISF